MRRTTPASLEALLRRGGQFGDSVIHEDGADEGTILSERRARRWRGSRHWASDHRAPGRCRPPPPSRFRRSETRAWRQGGTPDWTGLLNSARPSGQPWCSSDTPSWTSTQLRLAPTECASVLQRPVRWLLSALRTRGADSSGRRPGMCRRFPRVRARRDICVRSVLDRLQQRFGITTTQAITREMWKPGAATRTTCGRSSRACGSTPPR